MCRHRYVRSGKPYQAGAADWFLPVQCVRCRRRSTLPVDEHGNRIEQATSDAIDDAIDSLVTVKCHEQET